MRILTFALFGLILSISQSALAQSLVIGDGGARECYLKVRYGDPGKASSIRECKKALRTMDLTLKDEAATHVNLGILQMRHGDYAEARANYDIALNMTPNLPEAHINNSAVLIYMGDHHSAIEAVNKALELGTKKVPEALFNRAMAYDHLKKYNKAYADLKKVLELRPDWPPALRAIDNYEVAPTASQ